MRLIDADELLKDLVFPTKQFEKAFTELINDAPTIEVDPEQIFYDGYVYCLMDFGKDVVLCKDCMHHEDEEPGMVYCPNFVSGWVSNMFYCGRGERKAKCMDEVEE